MSRGTCLKCLSPLGKSSASLGIRSGRQKTPESKKRSLKPVALMVKNVEWEARGDQWRDIASRKSPGATQ